MAKYFIFDTWAGFPSDKCQVILVILVLLVRVQALSPGFITQNLEFGQVVHVSVHAGLT